MHRQTMREGGEGRRDGEDGQINGGERWAGGGPLLCDGTCGQILGPAAPLCPSSESSASAELHALCPSNTSSPAFEECPTRRHKSLHGIQASSSNSFTIPLPFHDPTLSRALCLPSPQHSFNPSWMESITHQPLVTPPCWCLGGISWPPGSKPSSPQSLV